MTTPQIAVGMLEGTTFTSAPVDCRPGDVPALLTDGLIEVVGFRWFLLRPAASCFPIPDSFE